MANQLKGAFSGCSWCHGTGCMACDQERDKTFERAKEPILSVSRDDMQDATLGPMIRNAIGAKALEQAFGPGGGGIAEVRDNCADVSLLKAIRDISDSSNRGLEE